MKRALFILGLCGLLMAACSDDSDDGTSSTAGSAGQAGSAGSAGTAGNAAGAAGEAGSQAGAAGQATDAGPDSPPMEAGVGACTNDADMAIVADMDAVQAATTQCAIKNMGAEPGTTDCIATDTGLSHDCAACFGVAVKCMMEHCISACSTDPKSASCTDCQKQYCNAALGTCSGIPMP